jgi:hypothetical protein
MDVEVDSSRGREAPADGLTGFDPQAKLVEVSRHDIKDEGLGAEECAGARKQRPAEDGAKATIDRSHGHAAVYSAPKRFAPAPSRG